MVTIETTMGNIVLELDQEHTPKTVANFLEYVKAGFYDGTIFHRVINGFMIQGGGFEHGMRQKIANEPIANEADKAESNVTGTIAMARTPDPHSATAQFFINVNDNKFLDYRDQSVDGWGYCVFGKVVSGMDVVEKIKAVPTATKAGHQDVPVEDVLINRIIVSEEDK